MGGRPAIRNAMQRESLARAEAPSPWEVEDCRRPAGRSVANRIARRTTVVLLLPLLVVGCGNPFNTTQRLAVHDVRRAELLTLQRRGGGEHVHGLTLTGRGRIDGEASVSLRLNGTPYRTEMLSGRTAFTWTSDWYADSVEIRYEPRSVRGGHLQFQVAFHTL
jgi:hypothetical protein